MASGEGYQGNQHLPFLGSGSAGMANLGAGTGRPANPAQATLVAAAAAAVGHHVVREQDRFMPIANVIRIMRRVLPTHAKISDDAKETVQECVSEYISFITSEANDRCQREQRKTITAEDIIWAMSKLGFDNYIEPLTLFLHRYREAEGDHRGSIRGDPLLIKHRNVSLPSLSDLMNRNSPAPTQFFDVGGATLPPGAPGFVVPPPVTTSPYSLQPFGFLNEGMGGYPYGMYGPGEGTSGSSSQTPPPPFPNFDNPYGPFNYKY